MRKTYRPVGGHILDIYAAEIGEQFLSLARNVNTRKGFPSRINGRRIAYAVSGGHLPNDPYHLLNLRLNTFNWWISFGPANIFAIETSNFYDISIAGQHTVVNPWEWASTLLNGIPVFTNGKDLPSSWDGLAADDALTIPGWPAATTCRSIAAFRFHLFAFGIDGPLGQFDNQVKWSDAADAGTLPASWTPAPNNEAGDFILADTPGAILLGVPLNQQLLVYKSGSLYSIEYAGQPPDNIFSQRCVLRTLGALSPHAVLDRGTQHFVVGDDDVVLTDGITTQSIADNRIKRYLINSIDETNALNTFVVRDANARETWVCLPESGNQFCTVAHIWDESRDTWVTRDLSQVRCAAAGFITDTAVSDTWDLDGATWDSDASSWNQGSTAAIEHILIGQSVTSYVEDTTDATTVIATINRLDNTFDDDAAIKITTFVQVNGTNLITAGVQIRLGARDSLDDPIVWGGFIPVAKGPFDYEVSGRFISFELQSTGTGTWTVDRVILEATTNGNF